MAIVRPKARFDLCARANFSQACLWRPCATRAHRGASWLPRASGHEGEDGSRAELHAHREALEDRAETILEETAQAFLEGPSIPDKRLTNNIID